MAMNILNSVNLNLNEIQNMVVQPLAVEPTSARQGMLYYNTTTNRLRAYTGSSWYDVGSGVQSIQTVSGETVIHVDSSDPENPVLSFKIASTQGDAVTLTKESTGLKVEVDDATTTDKGIVKLDSTPSASAETTAATPKGAHVVLEELATATTGYLKTYKISQGGVSCGVIDIPKDFLVKNATVDTVTSSDKAAGGKFSDPAKYSEYLVGDTYLDLTINVKTGAAATDEHMYILGKKLGKFPQRSTNTIATGSTSATITLPAKSQFINAFLIDENNKMASCDITVTDATDTVAGSVAFSIASAYTSDLTCVAVYAA